MSSSASPELEFNGIDISEAERLLASLWPVLEARSIHTPLVAVRSAGVWIDLTIKFRSAGDRALIEKELFGSIA